MKPIERVRKQQAVATANWWAQLRREAEMQRLNYYIGAPLARELDAPVPVLPKSSFQRFKEMFK